MLKGNKLPFLILILGIFVLSSVSFISAVRPVTTTQNFEKSYIISDSPQIILQQDQCYQVNFFLYNSSDGTLVDDTIVECVYYLANSSGMVMFYNSVLYDDASGRYGHWGIELGEGNFSEPGQYAYGIKCNSTFLGGSTVGEYRVTPTGEESTTYEAVMGLTIILVMLLIGFVLLFLGKDLEYIPFKIFLLALGALFLVTTVGLVLNIVNNLMINSAVLYSTLSNIYVLSTILILGGAIGLIVYIVYMSIMQFYSYRGLIDSKAPEE